MVCQDCHERPAVIVFTQIVKNEKTVLRLCKECAEKRGLQPPFSGSDFPIGDLLAGMAEEGGPAETEEIKKLKCAQCSLAYTDFKKSGRLGCSQCYETFAEGLKALLRKIHGSNQHLGKIPAFQEERYALKRDIRKLREEINRAIKAEEFEKAAALRDRINEMEKVCRSME
ncbi:MAG: UvrB/UvrC motif-containing protein [bacterium]